MNKTMEMYSPSHKKKVMAEVVEGYAQNSKGGTPRLALKGLFEGKKTLPKKVDVKTFEKYGFNAEQTIAAFHAESVGEHTKCPKCKQMTITDDSEGYEVCSDSDCGWFEEGLDARHDEETYGAEQVGEPLPESPLEDAPSTVPSPIEPTNANFSADNHLQGSTCNYCGSDNIRRIKGYKCMNCANEVNYHAEDSPSPSGPSEEPEPAEATGSEPSNENFSADDGCEKYRLALRKMQLALLSPDEHLWWESAINDYVTPAFNDIGWNTTTLPHTGEGYDDLDELYNEIESIDTTKDCGEYIKALKTIQAELINPSEEFTWDDVGETVKREILGLGWRIESFRNDVAEDWDEWENHWLGKYGAESAFDKLEDEVAEEYEEKGMSDEEAERIGAAVAYKQGVKKYGKKIMTEAAKKGVSAKSLVKNTEEPIVEYPDWIPAGDGNIVGQQNSAINMSPLHAETQEKICRCNEGESCYWCITDCQGCGKDFEEDHYSNDCQVCNKFYCDACIYPMQHYDTDSFRVCEPCLKKYPHLKGEFSESHYDREMNAESQESMILEACGICDKDFASETLNADGYCGSCCDSRLAEFEAHDVKCECGTRIGTDEEIYMGSVPFEVIDNEDGWKVVCMKCAKSFDAESKGVSKNAQIALGLTALGVGLALWKSDSIMNIIDGIKKLGE